MKRKEKEQGQKALSAKFYLTFKVRVNSNTSNYFTEYTRKNIAHFFFGATINLRPIHIMTQQRQ